MFMDRDSFAYKMANKPFKKITGEELSETDDFTRQHFENVCKAAGGLALLVYGVAVENAANNVVGDIVAAPPTIAGLYFIATGMHRAAKNYVNWKPEDEDNT
jgi:hypothetical protein